MPFSLPRPCSERCGKALAAAVRKHAGEAALKVGDACVVVRSEDAAAMERINFVGNLEWECHDDETKPRSTRTSGKRFCPSGVCRTIQPFFGIFCRVNWRHPF